MFYKQVDAPEGSSWPSPKMAVPVLKQTVIHSSNSEGPPTYSFSTFGNFSFHIRELSRSTFGNFRSTFENFSLLARLVNRAVILAQLYRIVS